MTDDVNVKFGATTEAFNTNVRGAEQAMKQFSAGVQGSIGQLQAPLQNLLGWMGKITAIAGGGALFGSIVSKANEVASEVNKLSKAFGISFEAASQLDSQLKLGRITAEEYTSTALRLSRQVRQNEETIRKTGMATRDANGNFLSQQQLMENAINTLRSYKEGIDRNIASQVLFGRGAGETASLLKLNADLAERAAKAQRELGLSITADDYARSRAYKIAMAELNLTFEAIQKVIGDAVIPRLTDFALWVRERGPSAVAALKTAIDELSSLFSDLKPVVTGLTGVLKSLFQVASADKSFLDFKTLIRETRVEMAQMYFWVNAAKLLLEAKTWFMPWSELKAKFEELKKEAKALGEEIRGAVGAVGGSGGGGAPPPEEKGGGRSATNLGGEAKKAAEIARIRLEAMRQVEKIGLDEERETLEASFNQFRISEQRKFELLKVSNDREFQAELELLQKELDAFAGDAVKREQVLSKILVFRREHAQKALKIDNEMFAAMQRNVEHYLDAVSSSFNGHLRGLLSRTETFAQALKQTFGDMILFVIQEIEKMGVKWAAARITDLLGFKAEKAGEVAATAATETAKTTATTSGTAARAAAEAAATEISLPLRIGKFLSDIAADAALTFAGIFANLSPVLGPAAAGPAAAGQASVLAQLANVPKFAMGTARVPNDMLAMIHQNEMIVPAGPAQAFRDALSGGGGGASTLNLSLTLNANGRLTKDEIKAHALTIADAVSDTWTRSLRRPPRY